MRQLQAYGRWSAPSQLNTRAAGMLPKDEDGEEEGPSEESMCDMGIELEPFNLRKERQVPCSFSGDTRGGEFPSASRDCAHLPPGASFLSCAHAAPRAMSCRTQEGYFDAAGHYVETKNKGEIKVRARLYG